MFLLNETFGFIETFEKFGFMETLENTRENVENTRLPLVFFFISLVFSNAHYVLSQCNTRELKE